MSDTSMGPGWWEASDGKWYPPRESDEAPEPGWWLAADGKWYPPAGSRDPARARAGGWRPTASGTRPRTRPPSPNRNLSRNRSRWRPHPHPQPTPAPVPAAAAPTPAAAPTNGSNGSQRIQRIERIERRVRGRPDRCVRADPPAEPGVARRRRHPVPGPVPGRRPGGAAARVRARARRRRAGRTRAEEARAQGPGPGRGHGGGSQGQERPSQRPATAHPRSTTPSRPAAPAPEPVGDFTAEPVPAAAKAPAPPPEPPPEPPTVPVGRPTTRPGEEQGWPAPRPAHPAHPPTPRVGEPGGPLIELRPSPLGADIDHLGDRLLVFEDRVELRDRADHVRQTVAAADIAEVGVQRKFTGAVLTIAGLDAEPIVVKGLKPEQADEVTRLVQTRLRHSTGVAQRLGGRSRGREDPPAPDAPARGLRAGGPVARRRRQRRRPPGHPQPQPAQRGRPAAQAGRPAPRRRAVRRRVQREDRPRRSPGQRRDDRRRLALRSEDPPSGRLRHPGVTTPLRPAPPRQTTAAASRR